MATDAPMATATDILTLTQWLSPQFPTGGFAYSHGLETAIAANWVTDGDSLAAWLSTVLDQGAGRSDALFLAASYHARDHAAVLVIDAEARAFAGSAARLFEADQQGAAFVRTTAAVWGMPDDPLLLPVAVGAAARQQGLDLHLVLQVAVQAFAANLLGAAQRLMPLGQTDAQRLLHNLSPLIAEIAVDCADGDLGHLSSSAFLADIAAMHHETQHNRIFRT